MNNPLRYSFSFLSDYLIQCIPSFMVDFLVMVFGLTLLILLIRIIRR